MFCSLVSQPRIIYFIFGSAEHRCLWKRNREVQLKTRSYPSFRLRLTSGSGRLKLSWRPEKSRINLEKLKWVSYSKWHRKITHSKINRSFMVNYFIGFCRMWGWLGWFVSFSLPSGAWHVKRQNVSHRLVVRERRLLCSERQWYYLLGRVCPCRWLEQTWWIHKTDPVEFVHSSQCREVRLHPQWRLNGEARSSPHEKFATASAAHSTCPPLQTRDVRLGVGKLGVRKGGNRKPLRFGRS